SVIASSPTCLVRTASACPPAIPAAAAIRCTRGIGTSRGWRKGAQGAPPRARRRLPRGSQRPQSAREIRERRSPVVPREQMQYVRVVIHVLLLVGENLIRPFVRTNEIRFHPLDVFPRRKLIEVRASPDA